MADTNPKTPIEALTVQECLALASAFMFAVSGSLNRTKHPAEAALADSIYAQMHALSISGDPLPVIAGPSPGQDSVMHKLARIILRQKGTGSISIGTLSFSCSAAK